MFWRIGAGLISGSLLASLALLRENTLPELEIYQEIQFLEMGIEHFLYLRWSFLDDKLFWKTKFNISKFSPGRVFIRNGEFSGTGFRADAMTWICRSRNSSCELLILYILL